LARRLLNYVKINIITLFPEIFDSLNFGLLGQAIEREDIKVNVLNLRDHKINPHGQVDDRPYGRWRRDDSYA
jgi:tRNA-(guanine-N1)-methyltransferase